MKKTHVLYTLLFGVAVLLFFGLAYPHHLHYQEQFQMFLFDSTYVWDIVRLPGGVADLLGRFCTQFFLYAWVGAFIIALLLMATQLLTYCSFSVLGQAKRQSRAPSSSTSQAAEPSAKFKYKPSGRAECNVQCLYGLSFVPSFLLWLFLLDENALLGGVWAVLLTLLAVWGVSMTSGLLRRVLLVAAVPVLYWMAGPVCLLFFLLFAPCGNHSMWYYGLFVFLALIPVIASHYVLVRPGSLWYGIHYYRYPEEVPVMLWTATLSVFVMALIARLCHMQAMSKSQNIKTFLLFALCFLCGLLAVWHNSNFKAEKVMKYDFMACHQQWNRILATINEENPNNQIGVTVQNLALAMNGMLISNMGEYNQNGISGLLPDVTTDATSPMPTAEAFYQLGMINVAQRTVFEAQEAILDFQKSARCYKRLAQTNLINGNYEVARKYLMALRKTFFYRDWADETMLLLGNEKAINKHPEYGKLRQYAYNEDFYFSDHTTPEMLESLFFRNTKNRLAYEYLMAYYTMTHDLKRYAAFKLKAEQMGISTSLQ